MTIAIGDDVFVRDPGRYSPGCVSITGPIVATRPIGSATQYRIDAEICHPKGNRRTRIWVHGVDVAHRVGVPLSALNGNAMDRHRDPGAWDRWCALSGEYGL